MSETSTILHDTATRLFKDAFTPADLARSATGEWLETSWQRIKDMGLPRALIPEQTGGFGLAPAEALELVRIAGFHAAPVPLAETMLANWLFTGAGLPAADGPLSIAPTTTDDSLALSESEAGWRLQGTVTRVPWARNAKAVAVLAEHQSQARLCQLTPEHWQLDKAVNVAGEPRDTLHIDATLPAAQVAPAPANMNRETLLALGAAIRCLAIAGAADRVLAMSVEYAGERRQFGRPIGKFQAVQQNLAVLAGHAAAAGAAADMAAEAIGEQPDVLPIAAAKVRAAEAAGAAAGIAHQIHGAIGYTQEHALHFFTQRLWAWRDEFGGDAQWSRFVGRRAAAAGADGLWDFIASA